MKKSTFLVFVMVYLLFSISGFLFPFDADWYRTLSKPDWTPDGSVIGMIWAILFGFIALSTAIVYQKRGFGRHNSEYISMLGINYILNQAFSYLQFNLHALFATFMDALFIAITTLLLIFLVGRQNRFAGWLLVPYFLWTSFATYLSWLFYTMN
ncbi:TspO/MBR family protein [Bacillus sp. RAR_GA_16]|uniref:TspO/MBR family protein n=1 Tax=Bacillus sp. RAR_GA_16 TaxID=2876774 RepID=UPI001CCD06D5|nr:TspO/MBR family protein [Bacillus sp. RAR_GA_16]MCA0172322.1 tryptophan-rich sensory protein [Bacillus sp. RAR_GA_16]